MDFAWPFHGNDRCCCKILSHGFNRDRIQPQSPDENRSFLSCSTVLSNRHSERVTCAIVDTTNFSMCWWILLWQKAEGLTVIDTWFSQIVSISRLRFDGMMYYGNPCVLRISQQKIDRNSRMRGQSSYSCTKQWNDKPMRAHLLSMSSNKREMCYAVFLNWTHRDANAWTKKQILPMRQNRTCA